MVRRGWGEGSICRRVVTRNGKEYFYWRAVLPAGAYGSRREKQGRNEREVRAWLRENSNRGLPARNGMTLGAYAVDWLKETSGNVKPNTTEFYRASLRHLDELANLPISALSPAHVRELIAKKGESRASRTVRGIVQTLALVLRRAEMDGLVDRNVAALVRLPPLVQKEPRHFTAAQARRFLDAAQGDADLGELFAVALGTGLRRAELLGLAWRDIDLDGGTVTVRRSKTAAGVRRVPLPQFAIDALRVRQSDRSPGPIWRASPSAVTRRFAAICKDAGLPDLTLHELRHTALTLMAEAGVSIEVRRWIAGHSKTEMTAHYSHESEVLMRDAVERLSGTIAGQTRVADGR